jgi:hypothetical protein
MRTWLLAASVGLVGVATVTALVFALRDPDLMLTQRAIRRDDVPHVQSLVREDFDRQSRGLEQAASRIARGFAVPDPQRREREMRRALHLLTAPPRGISELMIAPRTFIATVDANGVVICRDSDNDLMAGQDTNPFAPSIMRAIREGSATRALVEWPNLDPAHPPASLILDAAPVRLDGVVVGAVIAGTPLWSISRRLSRQLQAEAASTPGAVVWVYLYRGDSLERRGTPENLDLAVPDAAARAHGFASSPGGFTGIFAQFGHWYGFGVVPLPSLAGDVGFIVVRSGLE